MKSSRRTLIIALLSLVTLSSCNKGANANPAAQQSPGAEKTPAAVAATPASTEDGGFLPQVRKGFQVKKWAEVPGARSLAVSSDGKTVFVSSREGWVSKVTVTDGAPVVERFQEKLEGSNGVCFLGEDLLIAERKVVKRYAAKDGFKSGAKGEVVLDGFPDETHHGWRYIKVGPDGRIYNAIGAPCNVCEHKEEPRFASICSFTADGKDFRIDAHGVRNSVGFDWHPETGDFYFTDNGRDMMGDDIPACELNVLKAGVSGSHYGFPYIHAGDVPDPEFGEKAPKLEFQKPFAKFQAHSAPLGCYFPKTEALKKALPKQILVAQHGSWNRSSKVGYQVLTVDLENPEAAAAPFLWGFLEGEDTRGRPVDVAELPDGTVLVSDDDGNVVWAVTATP